MLQQKNTVLKSFRKKFLFGFCLLSSVSGSAQQFTDAIKLNQVGFYPTAPKVAVLTGEKEVTRFFITSTNLRDTFFAGILGPVQQSAYSKTKTRLADFSGLTKGGSYVVLIPGIGYSFPFQVHNNIYQEVAISTLKAFYFQRVSMTLEPAFAGKWHRSAGHPDDAIFIHPSAASEGRPAEAIISSTGGWYDAGDYNKYIVNSGITMGTLLSAYEDFPAYYKKLSVTIPESNDRVPDIINETIYNLRWMLTMQDPKDGGVYHKCTNAVFDGMIMPGMTKEKRYVVQKSTAATLDFAAVTAQAARVLSSYEHQFPGLKDSCLKAAKKAWEWAEKNQAVLYEQDAMNKQFKPEVTTGAYGDRNVKDEWMWAAAELYVTTKESKYLHVINNRLSDVASVPSWASVGMLSYYSMLRNSKVLPVEVKRHVEAMKDTILRMADSYLEKTKKNAFATVMGQSARDYNWGGNSVAANQSILLIQAYRLTQNKKYMQGALSNLDYILGRNATGYSFITGIGAKTPMHPHHRQSEADGITDPVPGLLVGGPNIGMQDKCNYPLKEIENAYVDDVCSYASNEIAINWQAPIVYLTNALEALKGEIGFTSEGKGVKNN